VSADHAGIGAGLGIAVWTGAATRLAIVDWLCLITRAFRPRPVSVRTPAIAIAASTTTAKRLSRAAGAGEKTGSDIIAPVQTRDTDVASVACRRVLTLQATLLD
jgi:hypothetical protein